MASAPPGMLLGHALDLYNRPSVPNNGGTSTLFTTGYGEGDPASPIEVNLPRVRHGLDRVMTHDETLQQYRDTGEHLGKFKDQESAASYADLLHLHQAWQGGDEPASEIQRILELWFGPVKKRELEGAQGIEP